MNSQLPVLTMYDCYERSPGIEKIVSTLNLRRIEWDILFALDGHKSGHEIGEALGVDDYVIVQALEKLKQSKLIEMKTYSIEEYRRLFLNASTPASPRTQAPVGSKDKEKAEAEKVGSESPSAPTAPEKPKSKPISFSLKRSSETNRPAPPPVAPPLPPEPPSRKLMPIVNFVVQRAGGGLVGQIAAYRVLLKVPQNLLQNLQIESLNLADPDYEIPSEEAYEAILEGVQSVLNVAYEPL